MAVTKKLAKPATKASTQVMDVKKASASATSRPIIVSSRPIMQDPMMVTSPATTAPELPSSPSHREKTIEPLSKEMRAKAAEEPKAESAVADAATPSAPDLTIDAAIAKIAEKKAKPAEIKSEAKPEPAEAKEEAEVEKTAEEPEKEAPAEPTKEPERPEPETETTDDETEDQPAEDTNDNPSKTAGKGDKQITEEEAAKLAKAAQEEANRKAQISKLVEEKTYFLPINQVERRRTLHFSIAGILLIILLAVAWVDLAADAGLITLPVKPVTHFFHSQ